MKTARQAYDAIYTGFNEAGFAGFNRGYQAALDQMPKEAEWIPTKYINLLGGPGTGKSTTAAEIFAKLKRRDFNAELITEYAKEKTWSEDFHTLKHQLYVTAKQTQKQYRVLGKVDVAVTDSPILLGPLCYGGFGCNGEFVCAMLETFGGFDNINIFLERDSSTHPYNPKGRSQTESQAKECDHTICDGLVLHNVPFTVLKAGPDVADEIVEMYLASLPAQN